MPVLLSTGDFGNRIDIVSENGETVDLTNGRSATSVFIEISDDTVQLQASTRAVFSSYRTAQPLILSHSLLQ